VGDMLALFESGIKNVLVLFGTEINLSIINYLLKINIGRIYISTNDDSKNNSAGNNAAYKIRKRLVKYFNESQVKIVHPKLEKDWNLVLLKGGKQEVIQQLNKYN
jgi:DNA primase